MGDGVLRFEKEFHDYLERKTGVLDAIRETQKLEDDTKDELTTAIKDFSDGFQTSEDGGVHVGSEEFDSADEDEVQQEQIVKQKR